MFSSFQIRMSGDTARNVSWVDDVLTLVSNGAHSDAARYTLENIPKSSEIRDGFIHDLLSKIPKSQPERSECITNFKTILATISRHCPVDDVIFDLIEASSENDEIDVFELMLFSFQILFTRERKEIHLEWCLSLIRMSMSHICASQDLQSQNTCFDKLLDFFRVVTDLFTPLSEETKCLFVSTLLHFLDLKYPATLRGDLNNLLETIVPDPFYLLRAARVQMGLEKSTVACHLVKKEIVPRVAFALYVHHAFISTTSRLPQIYSPTYIFSSTVPLIDLLLSTDDQPELSNRGMELLNYHSSRCQRSLTISHLNSHIRSLLTNLNHLMVYSESREQRELAFKTFDGLINCYDVKAQYHLFLNFRADVTHSGTLAFLISKIKSHFDATDDGGWFRGKRLFDLLKLYCFLPVGEKTNLVENAEQIIAALNFFWYLLVLNRKSDLKIVGLFPELKSSYLQPLSKLVQNTLDSCKQQLADIENGRNELDVNVSVQLPLPELSKEEKVKAVLCARNAAEIIDMNLQRVLGFWTDD